MDDDTLPQVGDGVYLEIGGCNIDIQNDASEALIVWRVESIDPTNMILSVNFGGLQLKAHQIIPASCGWMHLGKVGENNSHIDPSARLYEFDNDWVSNPTEWRMR